MAIKDRFKNIPLPEIIEEEEPKPAEEEETPQNILQEVSNRSVFEDLIGALSAKISSIPVWFEYTKEEQQSLISGYVDVKLKELNVKLSDDEKNGFIQFFTDSFFGFGELDVLLLREDISSVFLNGNGIVEIEKDGKIELSDIILDGDHFNKIKDVMLKLSAERSGIVNLRIKNLLITLLLPPVCTEMIIIRKLAQGKVDFEYLVSACMFNAKTADILKLCLSERRNILITGRLSSGKSSLLSAMLQGVGTRAVLFQKYPLIEVPSQPAQGFLTAGLDEEGFENLVSSALVMQPEYIFADLNTVKYTDVIINARPALKGFISSVRADSVVAAVSKLASSIVFSEKCTEKAAKAAIARTFDYILLVENGKLVSIVSLSLNKAGSLVMAEVPLSSEEPDVVPSEFVQTKAEASAPEVVKEASSKTKKKASGSFRSRYQ